jgi:hypothetical protein
MLSKMKKLLAVDSSFDIDEDEAWTLEMITKYRDACPSLRTIVIRGRRNGHRYMWEWDRPPRYARAYEEDIWLRSVKEITSQWSDYFFCFTSVSANPVFVLKGSDVTTLCRTVRSRAKRFHLSAPFSQGSKS